MMPLDKIKELSLSTPSKIIFFIMDGLGGLPHPETGKTELETAHTPNLDRLAKKGSCGLSVPVSTGITPGSAPSHLGLFGYDPVAYSIGRGVLEAVGINCELKTGDVAIRGNFCQIDDKGIVIDRRAGRISTEKNIELTNRLKEIKLSGVEVSVLPVKEHRFVVIFRGPGLAAEINDTDPQREGLKPIEPVSVSPSSNKTAKLAKDFIEQAKIILATYSPANMVLLRGFSQLPHFPSMEDIYKIKPAVSALYPMYKGLAKLLGMTELSCKDNIKDEIRAVKDNYSNHDFFFIHFKDTDEAGEDGDFDKKVKKIELIDNIIPQIMDLKPEVLVITGDHSTPATYKGHSWHPVPFLLYSSWCRWDNADKFCERACNQGSLGIFPSLEAMPLAMAHAGKLARYGA